MTNFRTSAILDSEPIKTKFTYKVCDGNIKTTYDKPNDFENVEYIGNNSNGDIFMAWDDPIDGFHLYFGVIGDEYYNLKK